MPGTYYPVSYKRRQWPLKLWQVFDVIGFVVLGMYVCGMYCAFGWLFPWFTGDNAYWKAGCTSVGVGFFGFTVYTATPITKAELKARVYLRRQFDQVWHALRDMAA